MPKIDNNKNAIKCENKSVDDILYNIFEERYIDDDIPKNENYIQCVTN